MKIRPPTQPLPLKGEGEGGGERPNRIPPHLYPLPQNGGEGRVRGTEKKTLGSVIFAKLNSYARLAINI